MVLESVLDDRNSKMKQVKDGVVDDVKIAIAAMKKLSDIVALSSAETPATIAERERVDQIRCVGWGFRESLFLLLVRLQACVVVSRRSRVRRV
jgi:hypothetical protein